MTEHIVRSYDQDLEALRRGIAEMGGIGEKMMAESVEALTKRNADLARKVIAADKRLDVLQRDLEDKSVYTLLKRQPVAVDLREVVSVIRIASDLERIGDLAKNIAKRSLAISDQFQAPQRPLAGMAQMSKLVLSQLKAVLDAYASGDAEAAIMVWSSDGEIDALNTSLFRELLTYMMEDPRQITFCTHLMFCTKNIERIGDHATNIAETVHYQITGQALDVDRPKGDSTASLAVIDSDKGD
jgi:phosphate transport system protein